MASILIADDSITMRKTLCTILQEAGHTITAQACNGHDAYLKFAECKPDLVTLDISMPYMNGIDALKAIRSENPYAKIVMVSSESSSSLICQALSLGAESFIIKPFCISSFVETINKVLQLDIHLSSDTLKNIVNKISAL